MITNTCIWITTLYLFIIATNKYTATGLMKGTELKLCILSELCPISFLLIVFISAENINDPLTTPNKTSSYPVYYFL